RWLRQCPYRSSSLQLSSQSIALLMCLGIGLVLRDLSTIQFGLDENDSSESLIPQLHFSCLNWGHSQALLAVCTEIVNDITICLDDTHDLDLHQWPAISLSAPTQSHSPTTSHPGSFMLKPSRIPQKMANLVQSPPPIQADKHSRPPSKCPRTRQAVAEEE